MVAMYYNVELDFSINKGPVVAINLFNLISTSKKHVYGYRDKSSTGIGFSIDRFSISRVSYSNRK